RRDRGRTCNAVSERTGATASRSGRWSTRSLPSPRIPGRRMSRDTLLQAVRSRIRGSGGPWTSMATDELSIRLGERPRKSTLARSAHAPLGATCTIIASVSTTPTRVVLADDDVLLREGLAGLLERSGFEVVGQSGTANELLELVRDLRP